MAESPKPFTYDGYNPLQRSPDGYLLPSPGEGIER
jgi:hypothetical protein